MKFTIMKKCLPEKIKMIKINRKIKTKSQREKMK